MGRTCLTGMPWGPNEMMGVLTQSEFSGADGRAKCQFLRLCCVFSPVNCSLGGSRGREHVFGEYFGRFRIIAADLP